MYLCSCFFTVSIVQRSIRYVYCTVLCCATLCFSTLGPTSLIRHLLLLLSPSVWSPNNPHHRLPINTSPSMLRSHEYKPLLPLLLHRLPSVALQLSLLLCCDNRVLLSVSSTVACLSSIRLSLCVCMCTTVSVWRFFSAHCPVRLMWSRFRLCNVRVFSPSHSPLEPDVAYYVDSIGSCSDGL
jgi:hypothetical protein